LFKETLVDDYSILTIDNGKANTINHQLIKELGTLLKRYEQEDRIRGFILTGKYPFFCAGLDVKELASFNRDQSDHFFEDFLNLLEQFIRFPKLVIAAINGYAPAGGCVLALCADYRFMVKDDKFSIGLNEIPVGLAVPPQIFALYAFWIGERRAYQNLIEGKLLRANQAFQIGLVDELFINSELLEKSRDKMKQLLKFEASTLIEAKQNMRLDLIDCINRLKHKTSNDIKSHFWKEGPRNNFTNFVRNI